VKWQDGLSPETISAVSQSTSNQSVQALDDGGYLSYRASQIYAQNPWLKPETVLSLAGL
jgi:hypothetical protein